MKLVCTRNNIRDAFQLAERFVGKNLTLPILGNILLEAIGKSVRCVATNLEIGVEVSVPCKIIKEGSVTMPGKLINSLLSSIDDEIITFEEKDCALTVKTDSSHFLIQGISSKDFPILPKFKKGKEFSISSKELKTSLTQVAPSVASSDFRPELSGIFFKKELKSLILAATDSFRLAEKTINLNSSQGESFSFILPARTAQELLRILSDSDDDVLVRESENQVFFELNDTHIVSRVVDGNYPDYTAIIPKGFDAHVSVARDELVKKIKAASVLASKLNDVSLSFSSGESSVEAINSEVGKSKIIFSSKIKGKDSRVSFNFRYLLDGLESLYGEELLISLNGDSAPALITDPQNSSFRYVVMPIRNV
ncbi:MAG: DNA polymerase III subunit beta [bacterium]|nr:DNA polymerase III subunit beta [bacterium]